MFRKVFASIITLIRPPVFLLPPSSSSLLPFFRLDSLIAVVFTALYIALANSPIVSLGRFALSTNPNPPTASSFYQSPASRTVAFAPAQSEFGYKAVSSIMVVGAAIAAAILIITKRSNTGPDGEGAGPGNGANGAPREHGNGNGPSIHNSEDASPVNGANGAPCEHGNANIDDLPSFPCATLMVTQDNNNDGIDIGSDIHIDNDIDNRNDNDPPELPLPSFDVPIPNALIVVALIIHATQTSSPDQAKAKTIVKPDQSVVGAVPVRVLAPTAGLIVRTIAAKSMLERKDLFARAAALSSALPLVVAAPREDEVAESDVTIVSEDSVTMIQDEEEEEEEEEDGEGELLKGLDSLDVSSTVPLPVDDGSQYLVTVLVAEDEPVEVVEAEVAKVEVEVEVMAEMETKRSMDEQQIAPTLEAARSEVTAVVEVVVASKVPQDDQAQPKPKSESKQKPQPPKRGRYIRNSGPITTGWWDRPERDGWWDDDDDAYDVGPLPFIPPSSSARGSSSTQLVPPKSIAVSPVVTFKPTEPKPAPAPVPKVQHRQPTPAHAPAPFGKRIRNLGYGVPEAKAPVPFPFPFPVPVAVYAVTVPPPFSINKQEQRDAGIDIDTEWPALGRAVPGPAMKEPKVPFEVKLPVKVVKLPVNTGPDWRAAVSLERAEQRQETERAANANAKTRAKATVELERARLADEAEKASAAAAKVMGAIEAARAKLAEESAAEEAKKAAALEWARRAAESAKLVEERKQAEAEKAREARLERVLLQLKAAREKAAALVAEKAAREAEEAAVVLAEKAKKEAQQQKAEEEARKAEREEQAKKKAALILAIELAGAEKARKAAEAEAERRAANDGAREALGKPSATNQQQDPRPDLGSAPVPRSTLPLLVPRACNAAASARAEVGPDGAPLTEEQAARLRKNRKRRQRKGVLNERLKQERFDALLGCDGGDGGVDVDALVAAGSTTAVATALDVEKAAKEAEEAAILLAEKAAKEAQQKAEEEEVEARKVEEAKKDLEDQAAKKKRAALVLAIELARADKARKAAEAEAEAERRAANDGAREALGKPPATSQQHDPHPDLGSAPVPRSTLPLLVPRACNAAASARAEVGPDGAPLTEEQAARLRKNRKRRQRKGVLNERLKQERFDALLGCDGGEGGLDVDALVADGPTTAVAARDK